MKKHGWILIALLLAAFPGSSAEPDELTLIMRQLRRAPANPVPLAELKGKISGIGDPDREADALAVYCLGQLANENTAEALKAREAGRSEVILFNLSGHGLLDMAAYDEYL